MKSAGALKAYDSRAEGLSKAISGCKYIISSLQKGGILANTDFDADDYDDRFWSSDGPPTTLKCDDEPGFRVPGMRFRVDDVFFELGRAADHPEM